MAANSAIAVAPTMSTEANRTDRRALLKRAASASPTPPITTSTIQLIAMASQTPRVQ